VNKGSSKRIRCAIYTRVSTDQGLEQDFNSLDAQDDAARAYIRSQSISLSKVAYAITGTRWNGPKFFGLRDKPSKRSSP
jgi:DNA invertase Pin-like site-specific DNA recombinase